MHAILPASTALFLLLSLTGCSGGAAEPTSSTEHASADVRTGTSTAASAGTPAAGSGTAPATAAETSPAPSPEAEPSAGSDVDPVLLEEVEIPDPARGGMLAYRMLVPEGWEVEGGVTRVGPAFHMIPTMSDVTVRAPDGRGARFWSMLEYGWADGVMGQLGMPYEGRPLVPVPRTLGDYWRQMFEAFPAEGVAELRVVSEEALPEATQRLREELAPLYESTRQENQELRTMGQSKEFDVEARRLVIRYTHDGRPTEATIFAALRKSIYRNPGGSIQAAMWNLDHMYAVFGPEGTDYTADPVLAAIVRSRREEPAWQQAIQRWYLQKNQQIVAEGRAKIAAAARAAATARTTQSQDVLDISFQGWKSRNAVGDAGHASSVNAIHERTTYVEPGGTTVDLPSYYRNVYTDGLGHYVLHDDANWQINTDPAWNDREWQRIEPQR